MADLADPKFNVLEGGDGSGKTSLRRRLFRELTALGRPPLSTTGSTWLDPDSTEVITKARFLRHAVAHEDVIAAYVADRRSFCEIVVTPMLRQRDVICDRFLYSDLVYNELHFGISPRVMAAAFGAARLREPDIVFLIDVEPEIAVDRLSARGKRIQRWETLEKQRFVRRGLKEVAEQRAMGWRCPVHIIDNSGPIEGAMEQMLRVALH